MFTLQFIAAEKKKKHSYEVATKSNFMVGVLITWGIVLKGHNIKKVEPLLKEALREKGNELVESRHLYQWETGVFRTARRSQWEQYEWHLSQVPQQHNVDGFLLMSVSTQDQTESLSPSSLPPSILPSLLSPLPSCLPYSHIVCFTNYLPTVWDS